MARSAAAQPQSQPAQGQRQQVQVQGKQTKGQRRDAVERKRDERAVRTAYRKAKKDQSYLADDENYVSFATQLQTIGLQMRDIPGDGNCLFRALGDQLEGHGRNHMVHRLDVVQYMKEHKVDFEPFMEDDVPFARHLSNLMKPGTYAGNDSIVAFARLHRLNIIIHQLNLPVWRIMGVTEKPSNKELHISYHNGDHYSSVRKLGDMSEKPTNFRSSESSGSEQKSKSKTTSKTKEQDHYSNGELGEQEYTEMEFQVMEETGCQDMQLIRESLEDNNYDMDATIGFLLQITQTEWDAVSHNTDAVDSGGRSPQGAAGIWSEDGSGTRIFGLSDEAESSSSSKTQPNRTGGKKSINKQNNRHLREQKKQEKKQRQMDRHRQRIQGGGGNHSNTTNSSDEENSSVVLVGEMGALSI